MGRLKIAALLAASVIITAGCTKQQEPEVLKDGTYTAQMKDNSHSFIKRWDNAYMKNMKSIQNTYPNEYTRYYAAQLTGQKEAPEIDLLSGASSSGGNFQKLSEAVIKQALKGDSSVAAVPVD